MLHVHMISSQVRAPATQIYTLTKKIVWTIACCRITPVSSALGDVDQLLDAARVGQGLGILHVFAGHLVQGATDGCHGLIGQQGGVPPGETVDQVPHRILP